MRFADRQSSGDRRLFWDRVGQDGLPFRGATAPFLTDEEYESRVVTVADARNAMFDTTVKEQNQQYLDVMECCLNGWFRLLHIERFWTGPDGKKTTRHYVEWVEYYKEDGTRVPSPVAPPVSIG